MSETEPGQSEMAGRVVGAGGVIWAVVLVALAGVLFLAWRYGGNDSVPLPEPPKVEEPLGELLDVPCVERSGTEMTTHDLLGDYLVVDFIFTNCAATCPPLTSAMKQLQEATASQDDVTLVSITTDPKRDTPEVLSRYADKVGADPDRWKFLFMAEGRVTKVAHEGMKLGHPTDPILHSNRFALLDRQGQVRHTYLPLVDETWLDDLLADLDGLRRAEGDGGN